jgi:hypothetical protein
MVNETGDIAARRKAAPAVRATGRRMSESDDWRADGRSRIETEEGIRMTVCKRGGSGHESIGEKVPMKI